MRNVRNFWIKADVDGRKSTFAGGPVRKDGGFNVSILMRNAGAVTKGVTVSGYADESGALTLNVFGPDGAILHSIKGVR